MLGSSITPAAHDFISDLLHLLMAQRLCILAVFAHADHRRLRFYHHALDRIGKTMLLRIVLCMRLSFQPMFTHTMLADISVTRLCSVAAVRLLSDVALQKTSEPEMATDIAQSNTTIDI